MVVYSILLVDLSPTFYYLPKRLLVYGSMVGVSTIGGGGVTSILSPGR